MLTPRQKLEEARTAYHDLSTGRMPRVVVDQNGERVEFAAANATKLYNYIQTLERQLGCGAAAAPTNGPASFTF